MKKSTTLLAFSASFVLFTSGSAFAKDRHRPDHQGHGGGHGSHQNSGHIDQGHDRGPIYQEPHFSGNHPHQGPRCEPGFVPEYPTDFHPNFQSSFEPSHHDCGPRFPGIGRGPFGLPGFFFGFGSR